MCSSALEYFEDGGLELYHLARDPGERRNVAEVFPEKARELLDLMHQWREKTGAPVPTERNPAFDEAQEADAMRRRM